MAEDFTGETIHGTPVTNELVQQAVERAEHGYDVDALKRRGRPKLDPRAAGASSVIPVRMDDGLLNALTTKAQHDGLSRSEAIREAIRRWANVA